MRFIFHSVTAFLESYKYTENKYLIIDFLKVICYVD